MLEEDYSRRLNQLLESCECDVAVPQQWRERLTERGVVPPIEGDLRGYVRRRYNVRAVLEIHQSVSAIPREHSITKVVARDISRNGIGFLHADQLFPGERVWLWFTTGKRSYEVVRCVQHNESCFEIGAVLAEPGGGRSVS